VFTECLIDTCFKHQWTPNTTTTCHFMDNKTINGPSIATLTPINNQPSTFSTASCLVPPEERKFGAKARAAPGYGRGTFLDQLQSSKLQFTVLPPPDSHDAAKVVFFCLQVCVLWVDWLLRYSWTFLDILALWIVGTGWGEWGGRGVDIGSDEGAEVELGKKRQCIHSECRLRQRLNGFR